MYEGIAKYGGTFRSQGLVLKCPWTKQNKLNREVTEGQTNKLTYKLTYKLAYMKLQCLHKGLTRFNKIYEYIRT